MDLEDDLLYDLFRIPAIIVSSKKKPMDTITQFGILPNPSPCAYECKPTSMKFTPKKVNKMAEYPQKEATLKINLLFMAGI